MVAIPLLLGHGKRVAACCVLRVAPLGFDVPRCRAGEEVMMERRSLI